MAKKNTSSAQENIQAVEEALSKTEVFIEKNQNLLIYIFIGIAAVVGGYFGYIKFIQEPAEINAQESMYWAERYFERDSLNLALNGDGNHKGFLEVIDDDGNTKNGNLARYYAGAIYLKQGKFDEAIEMLEDFDCDDNIHGPNSRILLGHAYCELQDFEKAVDAYKEAADMKMNDFTRPQALMNAGKILETKLNDPEAALEMYKMVKFDHPTYFESPNKVDKYIGRAEESLKKNN